MKNRKIPSLVDSSNGETAERYQELMELFRASGQTPKEFVTRCLQKNMVSGASAIELMSMLSAKTMTRSFALANLTDDDHFRLGFYETTVEDTENKPIFIMQLDHDLVKHADAIEEMLETFARNLAEMISEKDELELPQENPEDFVEEAMETILDSLPTNAPRH